MIKRRGENRNMIVRLNEKQINEIKSMIENASFKGSAASEVAQLLRKLEEAKEEDKINEQINN